LPSIRETLIGVFEKVGPVVATAADFIGDFVRLIGAAFDDTSQVGEFSDQFAGFGGVVVSVVRTVIDAWPKVADVITKVMDIAGKVVSTVAPLIATAINYIATNVLPPLIAAFSAVADWVSAHWPQISSIIQNAAGLIGDAVSFLWPILEGLGRIVLPILGKAFEVLMPVLNFVIDGFRSMIRAFQNGVKTIEGIAKAFVTIWNVVAGIFGNIWNGMLQVVGTVVGTMIGVIKNIVGIAASIPGPWQEGAKEQKAALEDMEAAAKSWGHSTVNTLDQSFDQQLAIAKAGGRGTAQAYAQGFYDMEPYLTGAVYDYTGRAAAILRASSPPKQGPLREIDTWGERTADAYAEGWRRRAGALASTINGVLSGVAPRIGGPVGALAGSGAVGGGSANITLTWQSLVPPTPAQARAAFRAITPELVAVLRSQRVLPGR
jgi:hypothetical protein